MPVFQVIPDSGRIPFASVFHDVSKVQCPGTEPHTDEGPLRSTTGIVLGGNWKQRCKTAIVCVIIRSYSSVFIPVNAGKQFLWISIACPPLHPVSGNWELIGAFLTPAIYSTTQVLTCALFWSRGTLDRICRTCVEESHGWILLMLPLIYPIVVTAADCPVFVRNTQGDAAENEMHGIVS